LHLPDDRLKLYLVFVFGNVLLTHALPVNAMCMPLHLQESCGISYVILLPLLLRVQTFWF
jgi:hypothetical protein